MDNPLNKSQLRILQRQYFQLVEPSQLTWPDDTTLKTPEVQSWLFSHLFDTANITSPPPDRYQLRILKQLIAKLERSITDPEEDVWSPVSSYSGFCSQCIQLCTLLKQALSTGKNQHAAASADLALCAVYRRYQMTSWKQ